MEPLPADWRTVSGAANTGDTAPGAHRGPGPGGGRRASAFDRSHHLIAIIAVAAVATGGLALAGTLWLAMPQGELAIVSRAAGPAADGPASVQGLVLQGSATTAAASPVATDSQTELVADVEGAVRRPGVQRLAAGSRVGDAIAAAGGYGEHADVLAAAQTINLAEPLRDGAKVHVPILGETPASGLASLAPGGRAAAASGMPIDLNHADQAQLESLPGVGPVTAGKIISARTTAPFATIDDVASRGVVGASTLGKLRSLVTVTP